MIRFFCIAIFAFAAGQVFGADILSDGPFVGADLSKMPAEQARALREANQDVQRVPAGEQPQFAAFKEGPAIHEEGDPRREHVLRFYGFHYVIFVYKLPVSIGEQDGIIYGPQLNFGHDTFKAYIPDVTCTRFYTREALSKLLHGDGLGGRWSLVPPPFVRMPGEKKEG